MALDLGAGAGASTEVLHAELGYEKVLAVEPFPEAWIEFVLSPGGVDTNTDVRFLAIPDEFFLTMWENGAVCTDWGCPWRKFDAIVV